MRYRCRWLLAVVPFVTAIVAACETSSSVTTDPTPAKCQLTITTPAVVDATGGTSTFNVSAQPECAWETASRADWISEVIPAAGQGSVDVRFRVAPNTGTASRDGEILVSGEHVRVTQRAPCRFDLAPASQTVAANGGEGSVTITTGADCAWSTTTDAGWISLMPPTSGTGSGTIQFAIAANGTNERSGAIIVGGVRATVMQAGLAPPPPPPPPPPPCNATILPATQNIGAAGGAATPISVSAPAQCPWTAVSNATWISVASGASGTGAGNVALTVAANIGGARTGTVTIAGQAATVTQAACTYTISPATQSVAVGGGAGTPIAVTTLSACQWTASSNVAWLTLATGRGTGPGSVAFTAAANTGTTARTGTLTVAGQTATVQQDAPCSYGLSPTDQTFTAAAGNGTINVTAGPTCAWTSRSNAGWITVQSGLTGVGISRVTYSIAANTGPQRTGTISIADQTFTVTQQASAGP